MIGVVVRGDHEIERVDPGGGELVGDVIRPRACIDQDLPAAWRRDERGITLTDVELPDSEVARLPWRSLRGPLRAGAPGRRTPDKERRGDGRGEP